MSVNDNELSAEFSLEQVELNADYDISTQNFDALFKIDAAQEIRGSELINVSGQQIVTISSKTFVFEQGIATDTWIIEHNLNKHPSIAVVDSSGKIQMPDEVEYTDENTITVTFLSAFAGKAYLN